MYKTVHVKRLYMNWPLHFSFLPPLSSLCRVDGRMKGMMFVTYPGKLWARYKNDYILILIWVIFVSFLLCSIALFIG